MTTHRFREVAQALREQIALGGLDDSGALESEAALGARHGVSRVTVRRALELLREEGLVDSRRGSGWFAVGGPFHQRLALGTFRHAGSALADAGRSARRAVVAIGLDRAPADVAPALGLADDAAALRVVTVRSVGEAPLDVTTEWVPAALAGPISPARAADPGVWATLRAEGVRLARVRQSITAGALRADETDLLGAPTGTPLLLVRRLAVGDDGTPVALADHRYLAHRFSLEVEFAGGPPGTEPPGLQQIDVQQHPSPTEENTP